MTLERPLAEEVFRVRPFLADDLAFVRDSWLRSAWDVENRLLKAKRVPQAQRKLTGYAWFAVERPRVTRLLGEVTVLVACDHEDQGHIGAWLAYGASGPVYAYTKAAYRGYGLDEMLLRAAQSD